MKRGIALVALMLLATPSVATEINWIGIYADEGGEVCDVPLPLFETVPVYLLAHMPGFPDGIRAVEFRVENYPEEWPLGIITEIWTTPTQIGDPGDDFFATAWADPQIPDGNGNILIGTLEFFALDSEWIGENHLMWIANSIPIDDIVVVDHNFVTHSVLGDNFTFNCAGACPCLYETTASESVSWGRLKALF